MMPQGAKRKELKTCQELQKHVKYLWLTHKQKYAVKIKTVTHISLSDWCCRRGQTKDPGCQHPQDHTTTHAKFFKWEF